MTATLQDHGKVIDVIVLGYWEIFVYEDGHREKVYMGH